MTTIIPYLFGESTIRTIIRENEPWFVIADVCKTLDHSNPTMMLGKLHVEDLSTAEVFTQTGNKTANICNESGLYQLIFQSRKPAAKEFTRWVTKDVLPSIRKKGFYGKRTDQLVSLTKELLGLGLSPKDTAMLVRGEFPPLTRQEQRMAELAALNAEAKAQGTDVPLPPEAELFLSIMQTGCSYTVADFHVQLPNKHPLRKKTKPAWASSIGLILQRLVQLGKIVKASNSRIATYSLAESQDKIVPMEL